MFFFDKWIQKSKIKNLVSKKKREAKIEAEKDYFDRLNRLSKDHETELLLAKKDYEIEIEELRQLLKFHKSKEKNIMLQQDQLIKDRAVIAEASHKLYTKMNMVGEIILKTGKECEGIFQNVQRKLENK